MPGGDLFGSVWYSDVQGIAVTLGAVVVVVSAVLTLVLRLAVMWVKREIVDTVAPLLGRINDVLADTNERVARIEGASSRPDAPGIVVRPPRNRRPR